MATAHSAFALTCTFAARFALCGHFLGGDAARTIGIELGKAFRHAVAAAFAAGFTSLFAALLARFLCGLHFGLRDFAVAIGVHLGEHLLTAHFAVFGVDDAIAIGIHPGEHLVAAGLHVGKGEIAAAILLLGDGGGAGQRQRGGRKGEKGLAVHFISPKLWRAAADLGPEGRGNV